MLLYEMTLLASQETPKLRPKGYLPLPIHLSSISDPTTSLTLLLAYIFRRSEHTELPALLYSVLGEVIYVIGRNNVEKLFIQLRGIVE
jgi:hypothetical protein